MELTLLEADRSALSYECRHLRQEIDELAEHNEKFRQVVERVYSVIPKVEMEEDILVEEKVTRIIKALQ